ncbi:hypothetical protein J7I94_01750 [Streptomyces sp. ISL-12]|uniref:hypothetical protein n=1 Tax=Streptomyces sp. ISL-12 TaxID=2819177 RepID=UPI001BE84BD8|nr:hypothetical protein [Streptomyces sp. ISL-12]MBT2409295.1 hypothetical protein [Streptomyces sp. ISL-12]
MSLRDEQNPQNNRELRSEGSVQAFLAQHGVSVLDTVTSGMGASVTPQTAFVGFRVGGVIKSFVADEMDRVYDDSRAGAQELAKDIAKEIIKSLTPPQAQPGLSTPSAMPQQMNQQQSGGSNPGASSGTRGHEVADVLAQWARQRLAQHTPDNPYLTGLEKGVKSAVTGRAAVFTEPLPSMESTAEGARWAAWALIVGEERVRQAVAQAAQEASPDEAQKLLAQFDSTLEAKKQEAAGSVIGSLATGGLIGQAANVVPHPAAKVALKATATLVGGLAAAKKLGDGADAVKTIETVSPQTYQKLVKARNQALDKAAEQHLARSREQMHEQMRDFGPFG